MRAGGVDVLDIFAVALVADRAEALRHDHFGKAGHGIERRADFMTDFGEEFGFGRCRAQRLALGVAQLVLALLAAGDVAEYRANAVAADTGKRHGQRHETFLASARRDVEHVIEGAGAAHRAVEVIARRALALGRQQIAERAAAKLGCCRAEQRGGTGIGADDAAFGVERDDAVGRRVDVLL